jgi:hypothetical protein
VSFMRQICGVYAVLAHNARCDEFVAILGERPSDQRKQLRAHLLFDDPELAANDLSWAPGAPVSVVRTRRC